jgi:peroxiredoxin
MNHPTHVPKVIFKTRVRDESIGGDNPYRWQDVTTDELFANKKIVVFSLPGAFTPTCSATHLPEYETRYQEFKDLGVDAIYCVSVNDAFVMNKWAESQKAHQVNMIPDGSAEFTKGMGMLVKKNNLGFGERSWRYSMYVINGEIEKMFIEDGFVDDCPIDPFDVSDAGGMIDYLSSK